MKKRKITKNELVEGIAFPEPTDLFVKRAHKENKLVRLSDAEIQKVLPSFYGDSDHGIYEIDLDFSNLLPDELFWVGEPPAEIDVALRKPVQVAKLLLGKAVTLNVYKGEYRGPGHKRQSFVELLSRLIFRFTEKEYREILEKELFFKIKTTRTQRLESVAESASHVQLKTFVAIIKKGKKATQAFEHRIFVNDKLTTINPKKTLWY